MERYRNFRLLLAESFLIQRKRFTMLTIRDEQIDEKFLD